MRFPWDYRKKDIMRIEGRTDDTLVDVMVEEIPCSMGERFKKIGIRICKSNIVLPLLVTVKNFWIVVGGYWDRF